MSATGCQCVQCQVQRKASDRSSEAGIRERAQVFRERRERIATAIVGHVLGGARPISINGRSAADSPLTYESVTEIAVGLADALMARLDRDVTLEGK